MTVWFLPISCSAKLLLFDCFSYENICFVLRGAKLFLSFRFFSIVEYDHASLVARRINGAKPREHIHKELSGMTR